MVSRCGSVFFTYVCGGSWGIL